MKQNRLITDRQSNQNGRKIRPEKADFHVLNPARLQNPVKFHLERQTGQMEPVRISAVNQTSSKVEYTGMSGRRQQNAPRVGSSLPPDLLWKDKNV